MIYLFESLTDISSSFIDESILLMPPERRERAKRYRFDLDRVLCAAAYRLLMFALYKEYGISEAPRFIYSANGKPYLVDYQNIYFNMSHCKYGVVCAVSAKEVGADIQDIRLYDVKIARRVCTDREMDLLFKSHSPQRLFCELWTQKESYIKLYGGSIGEPLNTLDIGTAIDQAGYITTGHWGNGYHIYCIGEGNIISVNSLNRF